METSREGIRWSNESKTNLIEPSARLLVFSLPLAFSRSHSTVSCFCSTGIHMFVAVVVVIVDTRMSVKLFFVFCQWFRLTSFGNSPDVGHNCTQPQHTTHNNSNIFIVCWYEIGFHGIVMVLIAYLIQIRWIFDDSVSDFSCVFRRILIIS